MILRKFLGVFCVAMTLGLIQAQEFTVPEGWKAQKIGEDYIVSPSDLAPGEQAQVIVKPPRDGQGQDIQGWASGQIKADLPTRGKLRQDGELKALSTEVLSTVKVTELSGGEKTIVFYTALTRPDRRYQMTITILTASDSVVKRYTNPAGQITASLLKTGESKAKPVTQPVDPKPNNSTTARTPPGKGVKATEVEGVYMYLTYEAGVGGYTYPVYKPYLFLKDGWFWKSFSVPPADLDVARSRAEDPAKWARWKKVDGKISIQKENGEWTTPKLTLAKPGAANDVLSGSFSHLGGGGNTAVGGNTVIAVSTAVQFLPGGRFQWGQSASATTENVVTASAKSSQGSYRIEGYTIVLKFDDGRVERMAFAYMDAEAKDAIYIGNTAYLKRKKS